MIDVLEISDLTMRLEKRKACNIEFIEALKKYDEGKKSTASRMLTTLVRDKTPNVVANVIYLWLTDRKYNTFSRLFDKWSEFDDIASEDKEYLSIVQEIRS